MFTLLKVFHKKYFLDNLAFKKMSAAAQVIFAGHLINFVIVTFDTPAGMRSQNIMFLVAKNAVLSWREGQTGEKSCVFNLIRISETGPRFLRMSIFQRNTP